MGIDFRNLDEGFGPRIFNQGKAYLYFGGTAYLGIPQHAGMNLLYQEGISKYGLNNGTSRHNNIQLGIYDKAEEYAADLFKAESALISSSGYLAAHLAVKCLAVESQVRYSQEVHPALWLEGSPNPLKHMEASKSNIFSFERWGHAIIEEINKSDIKTWLLISNSINNLIPELFDFNLFAQINQDKKVYFVVDDSHGIGILNGGMGIYNSLPKLKQIEWIVVASMAKALGIDAGLILASEKIISRLKQHEIYLGASPPSAAGLHAFIYGKEFYAIEWLKLQKNKRAFENAGFLDENWQWISELPVYLYKPGGLAETLESHKVLISAFAYPDRNGSLLNRLVLSSWHEPKDIQDLIVSLNASIKIKM
ncbi:MAG: aminotransferase class I/II-fold pyridoxal phosphate-dependent enzyme [Pedobacter sp.]|nr:MAG: aminotransferase class I/II-fold pyridoxal phosphate-dependent enzyme [Pedobacter sp.]